MSKQIHPGKSGPGGVPILLVAHICLRLADAGVATAHRHVIVERTRFVTSSPAGTKDFSPAPFDSRSARTPLPERRFSPILKAMEVHFTPETEKRLKDLATQSGRATDDLVEDAMAGYFDEVLQARKMLNSLWDELKSGRVKPISRDEVIAHFCAKSASSRSTPRP